MSSTRTWTPFRDGWEAELPTGLSTGEDSRAADGPFRVFDSAHQTEAQDGAAPTLRRGDRGTAVRRLQGALTAAGHRVPVDGDFGPRTDAAVRTFQSRAGLTVDGVAGPATWAGLASPGPADAGTRAGRPEEVALGTLVLQAGDRQFSYPFTPQDLVWTAKLLVHEAGGRDDPDNAAVLWAMFNRYALFTHSVFGTFGDFVRAYSTTLQPVLRSKGAAARHQHLPPDQFVRTGGTYPGTSIPRGQLKRHLDIQRAPWQSIKASARALATRALSGQLPNPGIGLASEFASTKIYYRQQHKVSPTPDQWRRYTVELAARKRWRWVGDVPGIDQLRNAFFLDLRAAALPADAVRVQPPAGADEALPSAWEDDPWSAEESSRAEEFPGAEPLSVTELPTDEDSRDFESESELELDPESEVESDLELEAEAELESESRSWLARSMERAVLLVDIAAGQRGEKELTNKVFYLRHPDRKGTRIEKGETALAREWVAIRDRQVVPALLAGPRIGPIHDPSQIPPGPQLRVGVPDDARLSPLSITLRGLRRARQRQPGSIAAVVVHTTSRGPAQRSKAGGYGVPAVTYALNHYIGGAEGYPHYVIDLNGTIYATCDERFAAGHAGWTGIGGAAAFRSGWRAPAWWSAVWSRFQATTPLDLLPGGTTSPNSRTIGIELLILPDLAYTPEQYRSLARLIVDLQRRHPDLRIPSAPSRGLLGHEDVTPVTGTNGRADANGGWDPGAHRSNPYFDWSEVWRQIQAVSPGFGAGEAEQSSDEVPVPHDGEDTEPPRPEPELPTPPDAHEAAQSPIAAQSDFAGLGAVPTSLGFLNQLEHNFRNRAALLRDAIAHAARTERSFWEGGGTQLVESDPAVRSRLEDYARAAGSADPVAKASQFAADTDPWSAAFVCYVMREARAQPSEFRYDLGHDEYIKAARDNRAAGNLFAHFWLCTLTDVKPEIGDILCMNRGGGAITYNPAAAGGGLPADFASHADIVTGISVNSAGDPVLVTLGGNLSHSVRRRLVPVDADFRVTRSSHRGVEPAALRPGPYFAVVRIRNSLFEVYR